MDDWTLLDIAVRVTAGTLILMFVLVIGKWISEIAAWYIWRWRARHRVSNRRIR